MAGARDTNKTQPTDVAVDAFIASLGDERRERECRALIKILRRVTAHEPVMWGPSIIGFDQYHYRYESGREGDSLRLGFSPRTSKLSLHGIGRNEQITEMLSRLRKHTLGKGCIYVNRLDDVDLTVLEELFRHSYATFWRADAP
jgi:hypothetical protein